MYRIVTTVSGYVSYRGKMYRCRPSDNCAICVFCLIHKLEIDGHLGHAYLESTPSQPKKGKKNKLAVRKQTKRKTPCMIGLTW